MRRDNRPYWIRRAREWAERTYARLYLEPSFDAVGPGLDVARPWDIDVFGPNIRLGAHVHLRAAIGARIRLSTWQTNGRDGEISIGDYVLISPGVRIVSSERITIGSNTMIASYCYISDSDWHDTYDRTGEHDKHAPIVLEDNVWLGDSVHVCKGVTIGANSIVGTGAVVAHSIPPNSIAVGNPARVVRTLDPERELRRRADYFADPAKLERDMDQLQRYLLRNNTLWDWLRSLVAPRRDQ